MKKLTLTIALSIFSFLTYSQFRFADLELRLISHEQNMFIKGFFHDTLEFRVTNLGPDTIFTRDTFLFEGTIIGGLQAFDSSTYIGLDYNLPPNVSFTIRWPLTIDLDRDYDWALAVYDVGAFTRHFRNPLRNETLEEQWNNRVYWNITYRSATSSIANASRVQSSIYPNPSQGELTLKTNVGVQMQKAELYDLSGRLLLTQALNGLPEEHLDLSSLKNGLYQLHLHTSEGLSVQKLVLGR